MGIETFKGRVQDLARPNRFTIGGGGLDGELEFLAKGGSLPSATLGIMPVPYMGREIKYAGDRVYDDWDVTVYQDGQSGRIRRAIDTWMRVALEHDANTGATDNALYKKPMVVTQLNRQGLPLIIYVLHGCFPTSLGQLDLEWGTNDTPAEFPVTFAYDWHQIVG